MRVFSVVRAGVAKNSKIQCSRMKLFIQPDILVTCQKSIISFSLKVSPYTENKAVCLKKLVQHKVIWKMVWKMVSVLSQIT